MRNAEFLPPSNDKAMLYAVLTVSEAAAIWHYNVTTIRRAIDTGRLTARQTTRVWLITRSSLIAAFGIPHKIAA